MTTHSITLAWKIPWMEEPGGYSPWGYKDSDTTEQLLFHFPLTSRGHREPRDPAPAVIAMSVAQGEPLELHIVMAVTQAFIYS